MRRARGLLLGCCGLRCFWHSLAVYLGLCDGVELGGYTLFLYLVIYKNIANFALLL